MRYYRTQDELARAAVREMAPWPVRFALGVVAGVIVVALAIWAAVVGIALLGFLWLAVTA